MKLLVSVLSIILINLIFLPTSTLAFKTATSKIIFKNLKRLDLLSPFIKKADAIPLNKLDDLAGILKSGPKGLAKLNKTLGKMNLSNAARQDIYLRLGIFKGVFKRSQADDLLRNLRNVDGFTGTLSKSIANNTRLSSGHLSELNIALDLKKRGGEILSLGEKFNDGIKKGLTDLDLKAVVNNKKVLAEIKNYNSDSSFNLINLRADMDSLVQYEKLNVVKDGLKVLAISKKPTSKTTQKLLERAAKDRGVNLIYGSPEVITKKIKLLSRV